MEANASHDSTINKYKQHLILLMGNRFFWTASTLLISHLMVATAHYFSLVNLTENKTLWLTLGTAIGLGFITAFTLESFLLHPLKRMVQEYDNKHLELSQALEEARRTLVQVTLQQEALLTRTSREISTQYGYVLSYANHLEEAIQRRSNDPMLRYDFDDVCESSFNLKLIAGSLSLLNATEPHAVSPVSVAYIMQQTLLALAPSLDRRAMQLSTAEFDETLMASTNPAIISQIFWMMLLGIIRYAEHESTLHMGCTLNPQTREVVMRIMVSELSPGRLSEAERAAHFARQIRHSTAGLFAETIREHASLQVAELLLARVMGRIVLIPLSSYSCEIQLMIPTIADSNRTQ